MQGKAIETIKKNGLLNDASFMIGIPTETLEELKMTEKFIKKYKPEIADVKIFNPLPGSRVFDNLVQEGKIKKPSTLNEWADWTGNLRIVKHNFSEISDDVLMNAAEGLFGLNYYRARIKKVLYWAKRGKFIYLLRKSSQNLFRRYSTAKIGWS